MPGPKRITVRSYSGYKANERPVSFELDERNVSIERIIDRWAGVESDYFKVLGNDGCVYLLKWNRSPDIWFLEKRFERRGLHEGI